MIARTFSAGIVILSIVLQAQSESSPLPGNTAALEAAKAIPDGGDYNSSWKGSGTPKEIRLNNVVVLPKGQDGTYCSGFTFTVVTDAARKLQLLGTLSAAELKKFQRQWYGATDDSREKQCVTALEALAIGKEVSHDEAQPGDFVQFWREKSGHSVVFLDWVTEGGKRVGIRYRSSQAATKGVGNNTEFFSDTAGTKGTVDRKRLYFGRLRGK